MSEPLSIETNIKEAIEAARFDASIEAEVGNIITEAYNRFEFRLIGGAVIAPGEGEWPVGRLVNPGTRKEWYAKQRKDGSYNPRSQQSGRSLAAWRSVQRGLNLSAINDAKDGRRRFYADVVHKRGEPLAKDIAWRIFEEEFANAAPEFERVIARAMNRG